MQIFFEQSDRSSHEYPEQYLYLGLPWKDYRLCTKQFLSQNYHRTFPQFREIGWYLTWKYFKILRSWNYLFRSTAHRKACFLYCGWYHSFKDKAFVTGSASNWRCVFPPVPFKGKTGLGHQAVAVMLSCNGIVLNYAFVLYNKSISKIDIVQSIAKELPESPVMSYFLCDCWYVSEKLINTFVQKGFHTIGALKTNRLLYPSGMKKKLSELAAELSVTEKGFDLVTVKNRKYYVYRYEGNLNGIENAVVLLSYPEKAFGNPKALRAFISTNVALSTLEILSCYVCRWPIEVFFRQCKTRLALDTYQIRSSKGIQRYWLLMSMAHYITILYDKYIPFRLFFHLGKLFCLLYPEGVLFDFLILFFISDRTAGHQCTYCSCCIMCYFFVEMIGSVDFVAPVFL